jgi:hypothetical protein
MGMVLDGVDPQLIHYTAEDEELQKRVCATLRGNRQSVVVIDNAKVLRPGSSISSATIESNSMAPEISLRILGTSENYTRPNDVLWVLTMNDTKTSPDLVSRALPIRLRLEGQPESRTFDGRDPVEYARRHRATIQGELAGMVYHWNAQGRPEGNQGHRLAKWATIVGGILVANGLPEGLTNLAEAASEFDAGLEELAALAEAYLATRKGGPKDALQASEWADLFESTKVVADVRDWAKTPKSAATVIGKYLSRYVGRQVPIQIRDQAGIATLETQTGRSKTKRYYFEVVWDSSPSARSPSDALDGQAALNGQGTPKSASSARLGPLQGPLAGDPLAPLPGGNAEPWN